MPNALAHPAKQKVRQLGERTWQGLVDAMAFEFGEVSRN